MEKVKTISEVIEFMKSGCTPKENFLFQNTIYTFDSGVNIENEFMYMTFKHKVSDDSLSNITFFFNEYGRLKNITLSYYSLIKNKRSSKVKQIDYCIYNIRWSYEQKKDAFYNFGMM